MTKLTFALVGAAVVLIVGYGLLSAQEPAPTAEELILRPGDTITWSPTAPHQVRFGGAVTHGGNKLVLTPFADVQKLLEITPVMTPNANGDAIAGSGEKVTGKVKADAVTSGVPEFFFTCGVPQHANSMVTVPFTMAPSAGQPARTIEILSSPMPPSSSNPLRWLLKTPQGNKKLTRP